MNTICWNESGQLILSGSDDQHLVITEPFNGKVCLVCNSASTEFMLPIKLKAVVYVAYDFVLIIH